MKKMKRHEEIDKLLSRSKSVSFNDLVEIRGVVRIVFAAVFMAFN